jgi:hypothetical protein
MEVGQLGIQMINNNKCKFKKETVSLVLQINNFNKMKVILVKKMERAKAITANKMTQNQVKMKILAKKV